MPWLYPKMTALCQLPCLPMTPEMTYCLCNVIDNYSAIGISVVHWRQRLISLLAGGIPYLKLDCSSVV